MDSTALLSTFSALAGTIIGAVTSFATTWISTRAQTKAARREAEIKRREEIYGAFADALGQLFQHAITSDTIDYKAMTQAYALRARIILRSSDAVCAQADAAIKFIFDLTLSPNRTDAEIRELLNTPDMDELNKFAHACRKELQTIL